MRASPLAVAALVAGCLCAPASAQEAQGRVVLRWQAVPGATGYDLQISADPSFQRRELEQRVELSGYRLGALPEARRYWRVRSVDADGRPGPWSTTKVIEPPRRAPEPVAEPEVVPLDVPPLTPAQVDRPPLADGPGIPVVVLHPAGGAISESAATVPDGALEGFTLQDVLQQGRPGVLAGWRSNLLGVDAAAIALEGGWPLPWLGARWSAILRAGWWRKRVTVPGAGGFAGAFDATADVFPLAALVSGSHRLRWARLYAGAGGGADLVVMKVPHRGALDASAAVLAIAGAGRRLGPGELFAELSGGVGGVDNSVGRLRTGGISLSLGYRLGR